MRNTLVLVGFLLLANVAAKQRDEHPAKGAIYGVAIGQDGHPAKGIGFHLASGTRLKLDVQLVPLESE